MKPIIKQALNHAMTYQQYRTLVNDLHAMGKATGPIQSEAMTHYSELNIQRMNKWDKHFKLTDEQAAEIAKITDKQTWLVIAEGWCGDASHALPVMNAFATINSNIEFAVVLRDENLELMDQYLTNGGRSIPKLIILDEDLNEIGTWGPRPKEAGAIYTRAKEENTPKEEFNKQVQVWYARNRGKAIADELIETALQPV